MRKRVFSTVLMLLLSSVMISMLGVMIYAADIADPTAIYLIEEKTISVADGCTLRPTVTPENQTAVYTWTTSDAAVVQVYSAGRGNSGNIVGISAGTAVVTATTQNGLSASCTVTVIPSEEPTAILLEEEYQVSVDGDVYLVPALEPQNAKALYAFTSSDPSVCRVSSAGIGNSGYIFGVAPGTAVITVTANNGVASSAIVTVREKTIPTSFDGMPMDLEVQLGAYQQIPLKVLPVEAATKFSWASEDIGIVSLWGAGAGSSLNIYGTAIGTELVTVTTTEGLTWDICVTVRSEICEADKHEIRYSALKPATCKQRGTEAHYECSICAAWFTDENADTEIAEKSQLILPADLQNHTYQNGVCTGCGDVKYIAEGVCGDNLTWVLDEEGTLTVSGTGEMYDYDWNGGPWSSYHEQIKKIVIEYGVTSIGKMAFYGQVGTGRYDEKYPQLSDVHIAESVTVLRERSFNDNPGLKSITLPDSIVEIGAAAFQDCYFLTSVNLGSGLKVIGDYAFDVCAMPEIHLPDNLETIGVQAFSNNDALKEVDIPEGVKSIGLWAFAACENLERVSVPSTVETMGKNPFCINPSLSELTVASENLYYCSVDNALYSKDKTILYAAPGGYTGEYRIADTVTEIAEDAFYGNHWMTKVTVPDNVKKIGKQAFSGTEAITTLYFEGSAPELGDNALCYKAEVYYPENDNTWTEEIRSKYPKITWIPYSPMCGICGDNLTWLLDENGTLTISGTGAMYDYWDTPVPWKSHRDKIVRVVLSEGVTTIGKGAFAYSPNLVIAELPDSLTIIGFAAFDLCEKLASIDIPSSVTEIGGQAFVDCNSLTRVEIPGSVVSIGNIAFSTLSISEVLLNEGLVSIGDNAFSGCPLREINLPSTLRTIGDNAFSYCDFTEVVIPEGVVSIGSQAFWVCENLTEVTLPSTLTELGEGAFHICPNLETINLHPDNPVYVVENNVIYNKDRTILHTVAAQTEGKFVIPDTVTSIGAYAFSECRITEIQIPDSVESMGIWAFNGCYLKEVTVPNSITELPARAFGCCDELVTVKLPEALTSIGAEAFAFCPKLEEIMIPDTVTTIGQSCFRECESLREIHIPAGLSVIERYTFWCCRSLSHMIIPANITELLYDAFSDCDDLSTVVFLGNVPKFETNMFYRVTADVYYPRNNSTWKSSVRKNYGGTLTWIAGTPCDNGTAHLWDSGKEVSQASCTEDGTLLKTCQLCGTAMQEPIPEQGHLWGEWKDSTETENMQIRFCLRENCDASESKYGKTITLNDGISAEVTRENDMVTVTMDEETFKIVIQENTDGTLVIDVSGVESGEEAYTAVTMAQSIIKEINKNKWLDNLTLKFSENVTVQFDSDVLNMLGQEDALTTITVNCVKEKNTTAVLNKVKHLLTEAAKGKLDKLLEKNEEYSVSVVGAVDVALAAGNQDIHELGGKATVTVPFVPIPGHDPENLVILYIDEDGNETFSDIDSFNPLDNTVTFTVDHFSTYLIVYKVPVSENETDKPDDGGFDDDAWYWTLMMLYNQEFDITASASEGGTITPAGVSKVKYDKNITYTIMPDEGYAVADVLIDGKSVGAVTEYTIKRIRKDHTITVSFAEIPWQNPFIDVNESDWFYEDVKYMSENRLMLGTNVEGTRFSPEETLTRAMLVTVLWRLEGEPVVNYSIPFTDVETEQWYTEAVRWAAAEGIVNGYEDNTFRPVEAVTREQVMAILHRYAAYKGLDSGTIFPMIPQYEYNVWAENDILWADMVGLTDGIGRDIFDMTKEASRAEIAAYLMRFCMNFDAE